MDFNNFNSRSVESYCTSIEQNSQRPSVINFGVQHTINDVQLANPRPLAVTRPNVFPDFPAVPCILFPFSSTNVRHCSEIANVPGLVTNYATNWEADPTKQFSHHLTAYQTPAIVPVAANKAQFNNPASFNRAMHNHHHIAEDALRNPGAAGVAPNVFNNPAAFINHAMHNHHHIAEGALRNPGAAGVAPNVLNDPAFINRAMHNHHHIAEGALRNPGAAGVAPNVFNGPAFINRVRHHHHIAEDALRNPGAAGVAPNVFNNPAAFINRAMHNHHHIAEGALRNPGAAGVAPNVFNDLAFINCVRHHHHIAEDELRNPAAAGVALNVFNNPASFNRAIHHHHHAEDELRNPAAAGVAPNVFNNPASFNRAIHHHHHAEDELRNPDAAPVCSSEAPRLRVRSVNYINNLSEERVENGNNFELQQEDPNYQNLNQPRLELDERTNVNNAELQVRPNHQNFNQPHLGLGERTVNHFELQQSRPDHQTGVIAGRSNNQNVGLNLPERTVRNNQFDDHTNGINYHLPKGHPHNHQNLNQQYLGLKVQHVSTTTIRVDDVNSARCARNNMQLDRTRNSREIRGSPQKDNQSNANNHLDRGAAALMELIDNERYNLADLGLTLEPFDGINHAQLNNREAGLNVLRLQNENADPALDDEVINVDPEQNDEVIDLDPEQDDEVIDDDPAQNDDVIDDDVTDDDPDDVTDDDSDDDVTDDDLEEDCVINADYNIGDDNIQEENDIVAGRNNSILMRSIAKEIIPDPEQNDEVIDLDPEQDDEVIDDDTAQNDDVIDDDPDDDVTDDDPDDDDPGDDDLEEDCVINADYNIGDDNIQEENDIVAGRNNRILMRSIAKEIIPDREQNDEVIDDDPAQNDDVIDDDPEQDDEVINVDPDDDVTDDDLEEDCVIIAEYNIGDDNIQEENDIVAGRNNRILMRSIAKEIIPDIEPEYLESIIETLSLSQLNAYLFQVCASGDYPKRDSDILQYNPEIEPDPAVRDYILNFKVEEFVRIFPETYKHFIKAHGDAKKYELFSERFLRLRYGTPTCLCINTMLKTVKYNLLEACLNVEYIRVATCRNASHFMTLPAGRMAWDFVFEILYIENIVAIQTYIMKKDAIRATQISDARKANQLVECTICYENELLEGDFVSCANGHSYCKTCVQRSIETEIGNGRMYFDCFDSECDAKYSDTIIKELLGPLRLWDLLNRRQYFEVVAAQIPGLETCPFCTYSMIPPEGNKLFICKNIDCLKKSCRKCKKIDHLPFDCDTSKTDSNARKRRYVEEKMSAALMRQCYGCGVPYVKETGCNMITCPGCHNLSCYLCRKPIEDYSHFRSPGTGEQSTRCPLYTDDRILHHDAVVETAKRAKLAVNYQEPEDDIENHDPVQLFAVPTEPEIAPAGVIQERNELLNRVLELNGI